MSERFSIVRSPKENTLKCEYLIFDKGIFVARFSHDFRGEGIVIEFQDRSSGPSPVGGLGDFVRGGGPEPLKLTEKAKVWLADYLDGKTR